MILALIALALVAYLLVLPALARALGIRGSIRGLEAGDLDNFIPEVWSKVLLSSLKKSLVYASPAVVNHDYEGEISAAGDTVHINSISRPTVADYVKGSTTITPEQLTAAEQSLVIDQAKYFAFEVDDIDARQAAGNVFPEAMTEAAYALGDVADQFVAGLYTGVDAGNVVSPITATTRVLALEVLAKLMTALDVANVPRQGRFAHVPPWFAALLTGADGATTFTIADDASEGLVNGLITRRMGFDLYMSNNVVNTTGAVWRITAGHPSAISYAEQINKTEAYRPQSSFSDAVKGLHLYGAKLVRPTAVATCLASSS